MPKVYNKRTDKIPLDAVYVGRPTKWGNPYVIGRDGNRESVIEKYERRIAALDPALREAFLAPLRGKDLVCWCTPASCHADVLIDWANSAR